MTLYILIFVSIVLLGMFDTYIEDDPDSVRFKQIFTIIILIFISFVSGTRLVGGSDYKLYAKSYSYIPTISQALAGTKLNGDFYSQSFDLGYLLITCLFKSIGIPFKGFTLIHSLFFNFAMYFGLKKYCKNFSVVLLVFICKLFFYNTFISMRQSITIAIFFLSLPLIENRQFIKYLIICILCFFLHAGSIIMLPVYFINYIHLTKRKIIYFIAILSPFAIVNMIHIDIITPIFHLLGTVLSGSVIGAKFLTYAGGEAISPIYLLEFWAIATIFILNYDEIMNYEHSDLVVKMFLILYIIFTILGGVSVITREKDYFILSYAVLLYWIMTVQQGRFRNIIFVILCLASGFEFFRYIIAFDNSSLLKYSSWLFNLFLS